MLPDTITTVARPNPRVFTTCPPAIIGGFALIWLGVWADLHIHTDPSRYRVPPGGIVMIVLSAIGAMLVLLAAQPLLCAILRYPRLILSPQRIAVRRMSGGDWAAWTSVSAFRLQQRPFGGDVGADVLAAEVTGPDVSPDVRRAGKFLIPLAPYNRASSHVLAEINLFRNRALGIPAAAKEKHLPIN